MVRRILTLAALFALTSSPAFAQEDGVTVDPNSPSGKEYAIPIEAARRNADPGSGNGREQGAAPQTFGSGIGDGAAISSTGTASNGKNNPKGSAAARKSASTVASTGLPPAVQRAATQPLPSGSVGSAVLIGGGLFVLLSATCAAILTMRRRDGS